MSEDVLVTYISRYGSTTEVAEKVGERLRERGLDAEVKPAAEVDSLEGVDRVVFGAPLYIGSLLKGGPEFLAKHQQALQSKSVAVFALGPLEPEELAEEGNSQLEAALTKAAPWLQPIDAREFIGKYDPATLRGCDKMLTWFPASPLKGRPATDNRDWPAIEAWADELAARAPAQA
ncbi:MAG: flavodoxin domain-containing protein [Coriobacteriia bacterium]|nr:flavodoxin domain-containing protein [Coriobacteriia bacterium]